MRDATLNSQEYQTGYLPWADSLIKSQPTLNIIDSVRLDQQALNNSAVLFRPVLDELTANLQLPQADSINGHDEVHLAASFEATCLGSVAINSLVYKYFVVINLASDKWPIRYGDDESRRLDQIVKHEYLRVRSEKLVIRTSAALTAYLVHQVPIGAIPEDSLDRSIDEGDIRTLTRHALHDAGISTYGDLGILSLKQIQRLPRVGKTGVADILDELDRLNWLTSPHRQGDRNNT